jgi:hypothetical protein
MTRLSRPATDLHALVGPVKCIAYPVTTSGRIFFAKNFAKHLRGITKAVIFVA